MGKTALQAATLQWKPNTLMTALPIWTNSSYRLKNDTQHLPTHHTAPPQHRNTLSQQTQLKAPHPRTQHPLLVEAAQRHPNPSSRSAHDTDFVLSAQRWLCGRSRSADKEPYYGHRSLIPETNKRLYGNRTRSTWHDRYEEMAELEIHMGMAFYQRYRRGRVTAKRARAKTVDGEVKMRSTRSTSLGCWKGSLAEWSSSSGEVGRLEVRE